MKNKNFADGHTMAELSTKQVGKFSCYVSNGLVMTEPKDNIIWEYVIEQLKKLYGDDTPEYYAAAINVSGSGLFFFECEYDMQQFYKIFEQALTDSSAIYACTFSPETGGITENT
jgi:hypothetical protein